MKKIFIATLIVTITLFAKSAEYDGLMADLSKQAKSQSPSFVGFSKERGEKLFFAVQKDKNNQPISCATCHQNDIRQKGKNPTTGKIIEPLAPSVNNMRLTDRAEMEKWLKRNFKQVYGREGTAMEKGDVLEFISNK